MLFAKCNCRTTQESSGPNPITPTMTGHALSRVLHWGASGLVLSSHDHFIEFSFVLSTSSASAVWCTHPHWLSTRYRSELEMSVVLWEFEFSVSCKHPLSTDQYFCLFCYFSFLSRRRQATHPHVEPRKCVCLFSVCLENFLTKKKIHLTC